MDASTARFLRQDGDLFSDKESNFGLVVHVVIQFKQIALRKCGITFVA